MYWWTAGVLNVGRGRHGQQWFLAQVAVFIVAWRDEPTAQVQLRNGRVFDEKTDTSSVRGGLIRAPIRVRWRLTAQIFKRHLIEIVQLVVHAHPDRLSNLI